MSETTAIQSEIEARLGDAEPAVEVLLAEVVGGQKVRLFIDHPDGVTLELCERVTHHLAAVRERYALEVSSPGSDRPLVKPEHFRRHQGRIVRVKLASARDGRRTWTGELMSADDAELTLAVEGASLVAIPYADIVRSNLVPGE